MIDVGSKNDNAAIQRLLSQPHSGPSAAHDDAVLGAADRLLRPAPPTHARRWQVPVALAATVMLALSIGLSHLLRVGQAPPSSTVRAGQAQTAPPSGEWLAALPERLRWPPAAGAAGYRVVLRDATADIVWTSDVLDEAQLPLAGAAAAAIDGLDTCIWSVDVVGTAEPRELGPFWFHLRSR